ncbi:MAG TPA: hypothetical protein VGO93_03860 [Candidatus Xenobia bacterium]|jgi:hypothetical protein
MHRSVLVALTLFVALSPAFADRHGRDGFHWTIQPVDSHVRSYEFDISHGHWTATLMTGDSIVSDKGKMEEADWKTFYQGLEKTNLWNLQSQAEGPPGKPRYHFLVMHRQDQHEAEFSGTTGDYTGLIQYLGGTIVGKEQSVLTQKLDAARQ